jgi:hypothetical protein
MIDETPKTMACSDCSGMVSKRAASCPHCGAPVATDEAAVDASRNAGSTKTSDDQTKTKVTVGVVALLFVGAFLYASKLDGEATVLRSRSDDVIATATRMSAADEAIAHLSKAKKLAGAATGIRIGVFIGFAVILGGLIAKRGVPVRLR